MTVEEIRELFIVADEMYLQFSQIPSDRPNELALLTGRAWTPRRPDLYAFLLLDALVPGLTDMVDYATHDAIGLAPDIEDLARAGVTPSQVFDLIRCGVICNGDGSLTMFV